MNGDDLLSELRAEMRSYADARATGSEELEAFVAQLATALNKPRMNEQALEIAQRMENVGCETWGDIRSLNYDILVNSLGTRELDAVRIVGFLATAQHDPQAEEQGGESLGSEDSLELSGESEDAEEPDEEVELSQALQEEAAQPVQEAQAGAQQAQEPAGAAQDNPAPQAQQQVEEEDDLYDHSGEAFLQEQLEEEEAVASAGLHRSTSKGAAAPASQTVRGGPKETRVQKGVPSESSGESTETALSHMSNMAQSMSQVVTALTQSQQSLQAAAAQQARGNIPPLRLQAGAKPSVKATKAWIAQVGEKLQDVPGFAQLLTDFLRDPKSYRKADMHRVEDPGLYIFRQVQGAASGVYTKMGGKETEKVGVLLHNIFFITPAAAPCTCSMIAPPGSSMPCMSALV